MCSAQYHRVFSTTRIPGEQCDRLMTYSNSRHVAVERLGHWYCIPEADTLTVAQLQRSLEIIKADASSRPHGPEVAALTGVDRSAWARARNELLHAPGDAAGVNYRTLEMIESAVLHLVLSDASPSTPDELQVIGQCGSGGNIWFDKSGSHIVCENGAMISNLEHSSADAVVPARLFVYVDEFITKNAPAGIGFPAGFPHSDIIGVTNIPISEYSEPAGPAEPTMRPWRLDFAVSDSVRSAIGAAKETARQLASDNIVTCFAFPHFGAKAIAQRCKGISSDSFMQMSLALAFFRDQNGEVPVTYETASLRSFFHGRTECIRPQSMEMLHFLQAFDATPGTPAAVPVSQLADLVRQAGEAHKDYTKRCMAGYGVDRHLMGLRIIAAENGMAVHPLFADKAYKLSTTYTLSTSQMPWPVEDWPGFGAYDPGAYGVCYRFTKFDSIVATVTSRRGTKDAKRFAEHIRASLQDMMALLSSNPPRTSKI